MHRKADAQDVSKLSASTFASSPGLPRPSRPIPLPCRRGLCALDRSSTKATRPSFTYVTTERPTSCSSGPVVAGDSFGAVTGSGD
jgi:hypothetical protein